MKKKVFLITALALTAVLAVCLLAACGKKKKDDSYSNVSRSVSALYVGESDNFAVSVETGKREKNFIADGVATDVQDFAEISIVPLNRNEYTSLDFTLSGDSSTLDGTLNGNNFGEFKSQITLGFAPATVTVKAGETQEEITLQNILEGKLSCADIINIAAAEFKDKIAAESADGQFKREIYVKLITGDRENYYYYVSYIGEGVDYWAMLINPETGEIVSKK